MQTYFAGMKWGRLSEKSQKEKRAVALPLRACSEKAVVWQNRAKFLLQSGGKMAQNGVFGYSGGYGMADA